MTLMEEHLLSVILLLPLLGSLLCLAFPRTPNSGVRGFAMAVTAVDFLLALMMWSRFDVTRPGLQLEENVEWIPSFGINYSVGVDGVAMLMIVLTTFLAPIVVLSTYSSVKDRVREYMVCLLLLQTGMLGAFMATDLFLFYVFWELMLIPMYFLIGIWGGQRRIYAALKFFLYTMAGSLLMLVAILYTVWHVKDDGGLTFSWMDISLRLVRNELGSAEAWVFLAFALAFAIKVPMFPFHTWLPDAHVEAPTGGSVILAGVLLKLGTFGFLRYAFWLFPKAAVAFLPAIGFLAVVGIIYGALVAMVQTDLKRLVAYSSVSHLGFVMLGMAAMTVSGISGGVLQMINHGISTSGLFLLVGVIYERRHTRMIADFGGLAKVMPRYALAFLIITFSSIGLPGLNGFVGEFMILIGTFTSKGMTLATPTSTMAGFGMGAVYVTALAVVILTAVSLMRTERELSQATKIAGIVAVALIALLMAAPPLGDASGGLLIRPLAMVSDNSEAFGHVFAVLAVFAATGVIFAAIYLLWAVQRVFFGPITHEENAELKDLSAREGLVLVPLIVVAIVMGLFPQPFLDRINPSVTVIAQQIRQRTNLPTLAFKGDSVRRPLPEPVGVKPQPQRPDRRLIPAPGTPVNPQRKPAIDIEKLRKAVPNRVLPFRQRLEDARQRRAKEAQQ